MLVLNRMFKNGWREPSFVMTSYLDRIGAGSVLADPEVMDFDWMPPELVGRDEVQRELASKFSTLAHPEGTGRVVITGPVGSCLLYTSPSPRDAHESRMPSSA